MAGKIEIISDDVKIFSQCRWGTIRLNLYKQIVISHFAPVYCVAAVSAGSECSFVQSQKYFVQLKMFQEQETLLSIESW